jgi:hypothetical protein
LSLFRLLWLRRPGFFLPGSLSFIPFGFRGSLTIWFLLSVRLRLPIRFFRALRLFLSRFVFLLFFVLRV